MSLENRYGDRWEGSPSWRDLMRLFDTAAEDEAGREVAEGARVVWIGSHHLEMLEPLGGDELREMVLAPAFAERIGLPFPLTYLDFRSADGRGAFPAADPKANRANPTRVTLHGAIVAGRDAPGISVMPIASVVGLPRMYPVAWVDIDAAGMLAELRPPYDKDPEIEPIALRWSCVVLRALYVLDCSNVELIDAPVSRQVRRAAGRRDARIAKVVSVTVPRRRRAGEGNGGQRNYSHAFERAGSTHHVCRGVRARADLLTPCPEGRDDERHRATGGKCRRIYVPNTIVAGDRGLPLVLKTRKVFGEVA